MVDDQEPVTLGKKIISFVLTLFVLPFLFMGTCIPTGLFLSSVSPHASRVNLMEPGLLLYGAIFVALLIRKAIRTKDAGLRWGIVTMLIASALLGLYLYFK